MGRFLVVASLLLTLLLPLGAAALSCEAKSTPAYFKCGENNCSLLFAVKVEASNSSCETFESGFIQENEYYRQMAEFFWNIKRLKPNKTYEVELPYASCSQLNFSNHAKELQLLSLPENSNPPEHLKATRHSPAYRCAALTKITEISPEEAAVARSYWKKKIVRNHLNVAGGFLVLLLGFEFFYRWVRKSYRDQLAIYSLVFLAVPIFGLMLSSALTLHYLIWPAYAARLALAAYGKQLAWQKYLHAATTILLSAIATYLIYQALVAISAL